MICSRFHRRFQARFVTVITQEVEDDVSREGSRLDAAEERMGFKLLGGCFVQSDV
jgi:hypothetical protein